jgi:UDP:flavonoid glycosyltransferase YjiC (YdhE family)
MAGSRTDVPNDPIKVMLGAIGNTGHISPVLALARELHARGHDVLVESAEGHRETVEGLGLQFAAAEKRIAFEGLRGLSLEANEGDGAPTLAEASESLLSRLREFGPDVVVSDLFTVAPALAAEVGGIRRATLIPHPYPVHEPGVPPFFLGMRPPRTPLGAIAWRAIGPLQPVLLPRIRLVRRELNRTRAELRLPPIDSLHGPISEGLTMVATFPQLEYPRRWPGHVHVTGPMLFDPPPPPEIELPEGDDPLVLVHSSTSMDPKLDLVRAALEALEGEPVRGVATMSRKGLGWVGPIPPNAVVRDWVPYEQVMPQASLVVCTGGHGTVARVLGHGVPVLVWAAGGDMAENGARVAWAGAGLMLPRPLLRPGPIRWAVRRVLADRRFTERARAIAAWSRENRGAARGAELVERLAHR